MGGWIRCALGRTIGHPLGSDAEVATAACGAREAWAYAVVIGAAACLYGFGLSFVLGRGRYWAMPIGDAQAQLVGYRYFIADSWHLPLLQTVLVEPPAGINILVLDSIPIVALVGKLLAPITGGRFVPYGLWMLAVYVLQAHFAIRLVRALGHRTRLAALAAAVLGLSFHAFLGRFYHQALNAQFLILWALCLYFELEPAPSAPRRFAAAWTALLVTALLVHPYLLAMTLAIFGASTARGLSAVPGRAIAARAGAALGAAAALAAAGLLTGHLSRKMVSRAGACCFGDASLNLGSLVMPGPHHSAIYPDTSGAVLDRTGLQWDGDMFLGFGVLLLLAAVIAARPRALLRAIGAHRMLATALLGMLLFAASNRAFWFERPLWSIDIPPALHGLAETFRASGRFAWPAGLLAAVGALALALRHLPRRVAIPLVLLCAGVELYDALPMLRIVRANTRRGVPRSLDRAAIVPALAAHDRVGQWPSYQCFGPGLALVEPESRELQLDASEAVRPINGVRAARPTTRCAWEAAQRRPLETAPGEISFYARATAPVDLAEARATCRPAGVWVICTERWASPALARLRALAERDAPALYHAGDPLDFGPYKPARRYLDGGWVSPPQAYDHLAIGEQGARLRLRLDAPADYRLALDVLGPARGARLEVAANGAGGEVAVPEGAGRVEVTLPRLEGDVEILLRAAPASPGGQVGVRAAALLPR